MNDYPVDPGATLPRSRSGCRRSCLVTALVLLTLTVVGAGALVLVGRSYLTRRLPAWEAQYPVVGLVRDLLQLRSPMEPGSGPSSAADLQVGTERQPGVKGKAAMPEDIPLYPDPLAETYSVGDRQAVGFQRVADAPDEVVAYLQEAMPQQDWAPAHEAAASGGYVLVWRKGDRTCQVEVVPAADAAEGASEIWFRVKG